MKNILVTGGAGYIGSHFLNLLKNNQEYRPIIIDNLSSGKKESISHGEFIQGDIGNLELINELFNKYKFHAVVHFAGSIIVPESVTNPSLYYQNNTFNTMELIKTCIKHEVKKFIFSSTAAVYGDISEPAKETFIPNPVNPYGRSKLISEWALHDFSNAYKNLQFVILRYFNVAGAASTGQIGQEGSTSTHLIKVACQTACGKRPFIEIFGTDYQTKDGTCIRDYIHIDDLAQAHLDALAYLQSGGNSETFNCGYGVGYSVKDVLNSIIKISEKKFPIKESNRRPGDPAILISDANKIRKILKWTPKFDNLDYIVKSAYEWEKKLNKTDLR